MLGDWVLNIGLTFYVFTLTGSTIASATMLMVALLPSVLLGSFAGVLVDRWDRKGTLVVANVTLALVLLPLLLVRDAGDVWIIYAVALVSGVVEQVVLPAEKALVPALVPEDSLVTANALESQNGQIARLVGSALGGVLAGLGGLAAVVTFDVVSFLVAAAAVSGIRVDARARQPDHADADAVRGITRVLDDWRGGLRLAAGSKPLKVLFFFAALTSVGEGVMGTLFAPFVSEVLDAGSTAYGTILSAQAVGGIVSGIFAAGIAHRFAPNALLGVGAIIFGALDLLLFLYPLAAPVLWPAFVIIGLVGVPAALMGAAMTTLFQVSTLETHRGRIFGAFGAIRAVAMMLGVILAGPLGEIIGIVPVIAWQGAGYVIGGLVVCGALGVRQREVTEVSVCR